MFRRSPDGQGWFPWLASGLTRYSHTFVLPSLRNSTAQVLGSVKADAKTVRRLSALGIVEGEVWVTRQTSDIRKVGGLAARIYETMHTLGNGRQVLGTGLLTPQGRSQDPFCDVDLVWIWCHRYLAG